ncbi:MAG: hypothetical protein UX10_C0028G0009 [Candidatus Magasanikbacteria bacterium GW2011_GWA2_45_39]|uniref:Uncharacterized protein n=1 Tax=Candidatus Magasanikbacteria bacterium GW2011_GWA2_45_39 TaxID=1619041 RepID=A0A0G1ME34_9BACT|nr:MAG: hypothetical protein UX10_C0028G0009 [Candidatus Magasanikbacteria bacterium GW2011_GWA2_45_39]
MSDLGFNLYGGGNPALSLERKVVADPNAPLPVVAVGVLGELDRLKTEFRNYTAEIIRGESGEPIIIKVLKAWN